MQNVTPLQFQRKPLVSIVIPVYNEEMNVHQAMARVEGMFENLKNEYDYECVFTDNCSTDNTFALLREMAQKNHRIRAYRFSRNFGYQKSILAAYSLARGDCAVQLDCDMQDPPEMIPQFLDYWKQGYKIVYGIRRSRQEPRHIQWMRKAFYRIVDFLSPDPLPHDAGDFRLIDRRILEELKKISDYHIYIRGRLAVMGFSQIGVVYDRAARTAGKSKFNLNSMFGLAIDAIINHSVVPLKMATWLGVIAMLAALLLIIGYFAVRVFMRDAWPAGFTTLVILNLAGIGFNGLMFGIMGEYIARLYQQVKLPADVIIEEAVVPPGAEETASAQARSLQG